MRGQRGQHHRARIGRGDEEHEADRHRDRDDHAAPRVILQQRIQHRLRRIDGLLCPGGLPVVQQLIERAVAEDRQPRQRESQRDQQHAQHELADGAATRDACNEQPHEGRPANPPRPIEHRPVAEPVGPAAIGVHVETLADHAAQIVAQVLHQGIEQILRGACEQHEQQQRDRQQHVDVRHPAHAFFDAGHRHQDGRAHHGHDQRHLHPMRMRHVEQGGQAGVEMQHAKAHVCAQAEHRGHDAQRIDGIADWPVDAFADQRIQRRAQGQRQIVAKCEVRQRHRRQREHAPAVQSPVQEQQLHGLACGRLAVAGAALRWLQIVRERFGDAEEEQRDADTGGEQHAGPGEIAEFRLVVIGAELDVAVARQRHTQHEYQIQRHRQQVVPAHIA